MSLGWMVTRLAWIAARLVSSKRETRYASADSCSAMTAEDWNRRSVLKSWAISRTSRWKLRRSASIREEDRGRANDVRKLSDEELSRLLVSSNFSERDRSGSVSVRLLDSTGGGGALSGSLRGKLFSGRLSSGRLSSSLLFGRNSQYLVVAASRRGEGLTLVRAIVM